MSALDLDAIEARALIASCHCGRTDIPALAAEIRRLRARIEIAGIDPDDYFATGWSYGCERREHDACDDPDCSCPCHPILAALESP